MLRFIGSLILIFLFVRWVIRWIVIIIKNAQKERQIEREIKKENRLISKEFHSFNDTRWDGFYWKVYYHYEISLLCFLSKCVFPNKSDMDIINNLDHIVFDNLSKYDLNKYQIAINLSNFFKQNDIFFCIDGKTGFILSNEKIFLNRYSSLFENFKNIKSINFNGRICTENVKNMSYMFYNCSSLQTLDLSSFDTRKVNAMEFMFSGCSSLKTLDLSSFITESTSYYNDMFSNCSSLESLDFSNDFYVGQYDHMNRMFLNCKSLQSINNFEDIKKLKKYRKVEKEDMFKGCPIKLKGSQFF